MLIIHRFPPCRSGYSPQSQRESVRAIKARRVAAFSNMQTILILTEAPPATRSRVMGIVTMCIGTGPVGVMMIGILSGQVGPPAAILIMAGLGLCGLSLVLRKPIKVQAGR